MRTFKKQVQDQLMNTGVLISTTKTFHEHSFGMKKITYSSASDDIDHLQLPFLVIFFQLRKCPHDPDKPY